MNLRAVDDPFGVESKDYSPHKFYTKSGDGLLPKNVQVPIPSGIYAQVQQLINGDKLPGYRSVQDMVRDAIYHRLRFVNQELDDGTLERLLDIWGHRSRMEMSKDEMTGLVRIVEETKETLGIACDGGDWDMVKYILEEARQLVDQIREPYKAKLNKVIEEFAAKVPTG